MKKGGGPGSSWRGGMSFPPARPGVGGLEPPRHQTVGIFLPGSPGITSPGAATPRLRTRGGSRRAPSQPSLGLTSPPPQELEVRIPAHPPRGVRPCIPDSNAQLASSHDKVFPGDVVGPATYLVTSPPSLCQLQDGCVIYGIWILPIWSWQI